MIKAKTSKISLLQALLIYIMALYSPFIRYVTSTSILGAKQAGWLVFLCSLVVFIPLVYILYKITKTFEGKSLHDIFCRVMGKPIGKLICVLFIVWMFVLLALYIKYAAGKIVTSAFVGTDVNLIIFLLALIVGVMLRWGLQVLSRMNKIVFILVLSQFLLIMFLLIMNFNNKNLTPISKLDIEPVLTSTIYPLTITSYITLIFIFNDQIKYDKKNSGKFVFTVVFLTITQTLVVFSVLGLFGYRLAEKLTYPLLRAVENISIETAGIDSLFISIWMIADYITISLFAYGIVRLLKNLFNLGNEVPVLTAVLGFAVFFAIYISSHVFELVLFSRTIVVIFNLSLFIGIPIILFITAKLRKLV